MADLHIRRLTDADVAPAAAIVSAAFGPSPWDVGVRRHLALQPEGMLLAEQGGRPVGVVSGVDYGLFASVGMLGVIPEAQRRGVAQALMVALLAWLDGRGAPVALLDATPAGAPLDDGFLSDIRARAVMQEHVLAAIAAAEAGPVAEGCVGAGTGVVAFGWKGGIGSSSRRLPDALDGWTVGALVQANFGGVLQIDGLPAGRALGRYYLKEQLDRGDADGSVIIVLATDVPLSDRNLTRLARRALAGLARTGAAMSDGSGDYDLAFSTAATVRRAQRRVTPIATVADLADETMSPLFLAAIEALPLESLAARIKGPADNPTAPQAGV